MTSFQGSAKSKKSAKTPDVTVSTNSMIPRDHIDYTSSIREKQRKKMSTALQWTNANVASAGQNDVGPTTDYDVAPTLSVICIWDSILSQLHWQLICQNSVSRVTLLEIHGSISLCESTIYIIDRLLLTPTGLAKNIGL